MKIGLDHVEFEATPENTVIFLGEETLLAGIYTDLDDDYIFLPFNEDYIPNFGEIALQLKHEGVAVHMLREYDPEAQPFCFIISALCRMFRNEIDNTYDKPKAD